MRLRIGTAGWTVPRAVAAAFPAEGGGLQRYAGRFGAVEINSSFYRPHRPQTYARWAANTPAEFRFALKVPRAITHEARLVDAEARLAAFLAEARELGEKLGPLLVQLPPSLAFDPAVAGGFFSRFRAMHGGPIACEPRHASWFDDAPDDLLRELRIARAAADPARLPRAAAPGGWPELAYWRWHGSPRMYYSAYGPERLAPLADDLKRSAAAETWCVFDNTVSGAAAADALALQQLLSVGQGPA